MPKNCPSNKKSLYLKAFFTYGGDGGTWTHTGLLPTDFKSVASAYSATTPYLEVPIGFEPMITELQSIALPLGYGTSCLDIIWNIKQKCKNFLWLFQVWYFFCACYHCFFTSLGSILPLWSFVTIHANSYLFFIWF